MTSFPLTAVMVNVMTMTTIDNIDKRIHKDNNEDDNNDNGGCDGDDKLS